MLMLRIHQCYRGEFLICYGLSSRLVMNVNLPPNPLWIRSDSHLILMIEVIVILPLNPAATSVDCQPSKVPSSRVNCLWSPAGRRVDFSQFPILQGSPNFRLRPVFLSSYY